MDVARFNPPLHRLHLMRNELGVRTIFNAAARMVNPADATAHWVGISHPPYFDLTLSTLQRMKSARVVILRGVEGGPEPSVTSETQGFLMLEGQRTALSLSVEHWGFQRAARADLPGGTGAAQAEWIRGILSGAVVGPSRDWVIVTAACGLYAAGACVDLAAGCKQAEAALTGRSGWEKLREIATAC